MIRDVLMEIGRHLPRAKYQRGSLRKVSRLVGQGKREKWWQARYLDYATLSEKGKPKHRRVWLAAVSEIGKSEAQKRLDGLIARALSHEPLTEPDPTFARWWARWVDLKSAKWSPGTKRGLLPTFRNHVEPAIGQVKLAELTRERLQGLLNGLAARFSKSLVARVRTYLKACLDDALEDRLIERNPARRLDTPRTRKPDEGALTKGLIEKLAAELFGRDRVVFRLFIACGLRPGEVFCLRRSDWDRERSALRIDETVYEGEIKEPKSKSSDSWVFVPPATAAELQAWLHTTEGGPDDWMFPSRTKRPFRHASYLKHILRPAAKRVGIPKIDFRMLRRSCATEAQRFATVKDTQAQMRHADPAVTLRYYQKEIPESVRRAFTEMDADLFGELDRAGRTGLVH